MSRFLKGTFYSSWLKIVLFFFKSKMLNFWMKHADTTLALVYWLPFLPSSGCSHEWRLLPNALLAQKRTKYIPVYLLFYVKYIYVYWHYVIYIYSIIHLTGFLSYNASFPSDPSLGSFFLVAHTVIAAADSWLNSGREGKRERRMAEVVSRRGSGDSSSSSSDSSDRGSNLE